jgi:hypothetical protein
VIASISGSDADRLVLAGEVVVEGAGRDARLGRDVVDENVVQPALHGQAHGGNPQGAPGRRLLALAQPVVRAAVVLGHSHVR